MTWVLLAVTVVAFVALGVTYVLFRFLSSWAEGQAKTLGSTVKYGGALAGFIVVYGSMLGGVYTLFDAQDILRAQGESTEIIIGGEWIMESTVGPGMQRLGYAEIDQRSGSRFVRVNGTIDNSTRDPLRPDVTFSSLAGQIVGSRLYFIYSNSDDERGVAQADLIGMAPGSFTLVFTDLYGTDYDGFKSGQIRFKKKESETKPSP